MEQKLHRFQGSSRRFRIKAVYNWNINQIDTAKEPEGVVCDIAEHDWIDKRCPTAADGEASDGEGIALGTDFGGPDFSGVWRLDAMNGRDVHIQVTMSHVDEKKMVKRKRKRVAAAPY
jgi:hypothetical protein